MPEGRSRWRSRSSIQPRETTLTDAEIEALSAKIVAAAEKAVGELELAGRSIAAPSFGARA